MTTTSAPPSSAAKLASRLRLATARLARRMRQQGLGAREEMTVARYGALAAIDRLQPVTLGALAAAEHVQPPSMTRIVDRLEELGLATRSVDADDRRVVRIHITDKGASILSDARTAGDAFLAERIARLTADERALLAQALPLLERFVDDH